MALPPEFKTDEIAALQAKLDGVPLDKLLPISREEVWLVGALIQNYNFIEFNLRRSLEVLLQVGLASPLKGKHVPPAVLTKKVAEAVAKMNPAEEDIVDSLRKLEEIELRRPFRNALAHCAARRFPGEDALVLLSKDDSDSMRIFGSPTTPGHCLHGLVLLPDLRGLLLHISEYELWLANKTAAWYEHFTK